MATREIDRKCTVCKITKSIDEFHFLRNDDGNGIKSWSMKCKSCDALMFKASRDGKEITKTLHDEYGNLLVPGRPALALSSFTEEVREKAIKQIKNDRSIAVCADVIGVHKSTLHKWLDDEREPYASWARRFRVARAKAHKSPFEAALRAEAIAGDVRALEFVLTSGFPEEYGKKKEVDLVVRKGQEEIDTSNYTVEELQQLQALLTKGKEK